MKLKTAIVIAGGKGMRLRPLTEGVPKCMIDVSGKPLLFWIITWLKNNGIKKVIVGVAHKKEVIEEYVQSTDLGVEVVLNDHSAAEGTGDAFRLAIENQNVTDDHFLAMNGDELTDVSLKNLFTFHLQHKPIVTHLVCPLRSQFGIISTDADHTITDFQEKPIIDNYFVNAGVYIFSREILKHLPEKGDIEKTTFRDLAGQGKLKAFKYFGFWNTINNVKDLKSIEENIEVLKETRED